jgi:uncharacterized protein (TIGR02453 family)
MSFSGFPADAISFFEELQADNSKTFWDRNKPRYETNVKGPMTDLLHYLEPAFGEAKLFRPHRDVRFSKDKRPYKENIAATIEGRYVSLSASGLYAGGGAYRMSEATLWSYREAVAEGGDELDQALAELRGLGYRLSEPSLKRGPRGTPPDHPFIHLLKHKDVTATRDFGRATWLHLPEAAEHVAQVFADLEPLLRWFQQHVG